MLRSSSNSRRIYISFLNIPVIKSLKQQMQKRWNSWKTLPRSWILITKIKSFAVSSWLLFRVKTMIKGEPGRAGAKTDAAVTKQEQRRIMKLSGALKTSSTSNILVSARRSRSVFMFVSNPSQPYPLHFVVSSLWRDQLTDGGGACFCRAPAAAAAFNLSKLPQRKRTLSLPLQQRIILLLLWNICEQRRREQKLGIAEHKKLTLWRLRALPPLHHRRMFDRPPGSITSDGNVSSGCWASALKHAKENVKEDGGEWLRSSRDTKHKNLPTTPFINWKMRWFLPQEGRNHFSSLLLFYSQTPKWNSKY